MNEKIKFCLVIDFSYFMNFFYIVNKKKSNRITNVRDMVTKIF